MHDGILPEYPVCSIHVMCERVHAGSTTRRMRGNSSQHPLRRHITVRLPICQSSPHTSLHVRTGVHGGSASLTPSLSLLLLRSFPPLLGLLLRLTTGSPVPALLSVATAAGAALLLMLLWESLAGSSCSHAWIISLSTRLGTSWSLLRGWPDKGSAARTAAITAEAATVRAKNAPKQQGEQDSHLCALLPCICRRAFCHQHMSSVVVQTQIMDSHPSTTRHISVRQTLFCQYCNLGMGQCPAQAVAAPMHALNMRAAHVTLHASMHVTSGIMCVKESIEAHV